MRRTLLPVPMQVAQMSLAMLSREFNGHGMGTGHDQGSESKRLLYNAKAVPTLLVVACIQRKSRVPWGWRSLKIRGVMIAAHLHNTPSLDIFVRDDSMPFCWGFQGSSASDMTEWVSGLLTLLCVVIGGIEVVHSCDRLLHL